MTKYLAPDEIVHLAFRGNGWTFMDPMLIITDRRILRLRDLGFGKWSKRGEVAARDVLGASVNRRFLFGTVEIHLRNGQALRVQYTTDTEADTFVDGLNRLIGR
nr:PH domain-containing protein [Brachybacterium sacelli]